MVHEPHVGKVKLVELFAQIAALGGLLRAEDLANVSGLTIPKAEFALALMEIQGWVAGSVGGYQVTAKGLKREEALAG